MAERLLRVPEVMQRTGLSRPTIYRWMVAGTFPKAIPIGASAVGWVESEIDAWIAARVQAARPEVASVA